MRERIRHGFVIGRQKRDRWLLFSQRYWNDNSVGSLYTFCRADGNCDCSARVLKMKFEVLVFEKKIYMTISGE